MSSSFPVVLNMKWSTDLHSTFWMFLIISVSLHRWWAEWRSEEVSGTIFFVFYSNDGIAITCTFTANFSFHFIQINLLSINLFFCQQCGGFHRVVIFFRDSSICLHWILSVLYLHVCWWSFSWNFGFLIIQIFCIQICQWVAIFFYNFIFYINKCSSVA